MRVLFVTKPFFIEPLGLMYLSAAAKNKGHEVELAVSSQDLEAKVRTFNPQVVGFSVMTGDHQEYLELNRRLKSKQRFVSVFGGPYPTFFPDLIEQEGVDAICRGEGEEAFPEFLRLLEKGDAFRTNNFWVKQNGQIIRNAQRPLSDIDSLPFPDREILNSIPEVKDGPIKHFLASRGCPFSCSYCFNDSYAEIYGKGARRVRFRDPAEVVREVKEVISASPTKFVYFQDDTFTLNPDWVKSFAAEYKSVGLPFHCHVRPNTISDAVVASLKGAGCYSVHIAAEAGNDRLRNEILKRGMTKEQIVKASDLLKEQGIRFMLQNIIGIPTGSIEEDIETLELNIRCKPDYAWVSIFQPYPGTSLGEFSRREGIYKGDFNDLRPSFFDSSSLNFTEDYKNQLANLQKLFAIFVENPELHRSGISRIMINAQRTEEIQRLYREAYTKFRAKADERLYGFRL